MKLIRKLKYPLTVIILIICIIYIISIRKELNTNKYEEIDTNVEQVSVDVEPIETYSIDIKGAVNKPGVYQVPNNYTVIKVIELSGGLTKDADTSVVNLAKKVTDEMVIIIYTKEEVKNSNIVNTVIKEIEKECVCPNIKNDGCINTEIDESIGSSDLVNINTATKEELQTLTGIGEFKAEAIIKYRETNGNFKEIEELLQVDGIGNSIYEQIKTHIKT